MLTIDIVSTGSHDFVATEDKSFQKIDRNTRSRNRTIISGERDSILSIVTDVRNYAGTTVHTQGAFRCQACTVFECVYRTITVYVLGGPPVILSAEGMRTET